MQRSAGLVLLAFVGKVALSHIERLGHAFVEMCRNDRAGVHTDVQHYRPQRVIRVADPQRDVALTGEGETIRLELTVDYFLIDHDTVSRVGEPPYQVNLGGSATVPGTYEKASPSQNKEVPGAKLRIGLRPIGPLFENVPSRSASPRLDRPLAAATGRLRCSYATGSTFYVCAYG